MERPTRLVILAKVDGTTAAVGFSDKLNEAPRSMTLGKEMVKHAEINQKTGTAIYRPA